jgi:hypothetical protein
MSTIKTFEIPGENSDENSDNKKLTDNDAFEESDYHIHDAKTTMESTSYKEYVTENANESPIVNQRKRWEWMSRVIDLIEKVERLKKDTIHALSNEQADAQRMIIGMEYQLELARTMRDIAAYEERTKSIKKSFP